MCFISRVPGTFGTGPATPTRALERLFTLYMIVEHLLLWPPVDRNWYVVGFWDGVGLANNASSIISLFRSLSLALVSRSHSGHSFHPCASVPWLVLVYIGLIFFTSTLSLSLSFSPIFFVRVPSAPDELTINQTNCNVVDGIDLDDIKEFAKAFKLRRLSLGLTQTQVGQALSVTEGPAYSQSAICR